MLVLPRPNWSREAEGTLRLTPRTRIEYADLFSPEAFRIACALRRDLAERQALALDVARASEDPRGAILLGTRDDPAVARALRGLRLPRAARDLGREGYILSVRRDRALIAGHDSAGLFHGTQTFLQLVERRGASLRVPCGDLADRPAHPFRGVHLYVPPRTEIDYFMRLIRYLALCKMNTIILEIGAALEFKRHPEINRAWAAYAEKARRWPFNQVALQNYNTLHTRGKNSNHFEQGGGACISQDDMRAILRCARENHVEIVPEIQSPGHAYWLCLAHPEVAEWAQDKYPDTFCPSNPRSYDLLFDVMDEVIDLLEPRWVSSGNDEYYFYALCPKCRRRTGGDILAGHLNRVNAFLRARGVKHIMWADKLINPDELEVKRSREWGTGKMIRYGGGTRVMDDAAGVYTMKETWQAVDRIPDDILMADWYYSLSPDTEKYFARHRKEVVFGNFGPFAFAGQAHRLYAPNVRGAEISTWVETGRMAHAHNNWPLLAAMTADVLWSDIYRKVNPRDRVDAFLEFWRRHRDVLNAPEDKLPSRGAEPVACEPWDMGVPRAGGADGVPAARMARGAYHVPFRPAAQPLVLHPGDAKGHTIAVGRKLRSIVFLYGMMVKGADVTLPPLYEYSDYNEYYLSREVGALIVRGDFAVKSPRHPVRQGRVPVRLGFEIGSLCEPAGLTALSRPAFCDALQGPDGNAVYAWEWVNPNPENMVIEDITLARGRANIPGDIVVYAVTLVLERRRKVPSGRQP